MIEQTEVVITHRVTCNVIGPRNPYEREKLVATIVPTGIHVWCKACNAAHLISRETCMAAWEKGESVQCHDEG